MNIRRQHTCCTKSAGASHVFSSVSHANALFYFVKYQSVFLTCLLISIHVEKKKKLVFIFFLFLLSFFLDSFLPKYFGTSSFHKSHIFYAGSPHNFCCSVGCLLNLVKSVCNKKKNTEKKKEEVEECFCFFFNSKV